MFVLQGILLPNSTSDNTIPIIYKYKIDGIWLLMYVMQIRKVEFTVTALWRYSDGAVT